MYNIGTKGKTDMFKLDSWGNDFERGDTDEYSIEAMDVGEILMIHLRNDGRGWWFKNPDWFVNKISVISSTQDDPFEFPCYRWVLSEMVVFVGKGIFVLIVKFQMAEVGNLRCAVRSTPRKVSIW